MEPAFEVFNVTNSNSILGMNGRLGPAWRNATAVLGAASTLCDLNEIRREFTDTAA
jgi:hypothetical protein